MIFMEKLDKIIACLRQMGMKPKVDNFQHKLIIQKTVCLFELMGMDLKYGYSLYVRGPYSPALAKEMHEQRGNVENLKTGCKLTAKEVETAEKVAEASDNLNPEMLEIMATYSFISRRLGKGAKESLIELKRLKPFYSEAKIAVGVSRAKGLFAPNEGEIMKMKKEFGEIEGAAVSDSRE